MSEVLCEDSTIVSVYGENQLWWKDLPVSFLDRTTSILLINAPVINFLFEAFQFKEDDQ